MNWGHLHLPLLFALTDQQVSGYDLLLKFHRIQKNMQKQVFSEQRGWMWWVHYK
jgi:hypothetical protein